MALPSARMGVWKPAAAAMRAVQKSAQPAVAPRFFFSSSTSSSRGPRRRFPLPGLHVGTDICHVVRIYAILAGPQPADGRLSRDRDRRPSARAARFVRRVLTPRELPDAAEMAAMTTEAAAAATGENARRPSSAQLLAWLLADGRPASRDGRQKTRAETETDSARAVGSRDPLLWKAAQFLAGRFAAKEAAIKAHPHLDLSFHQVRIVRARKDADNGSGPPIALVQVPVLAPNGQLSEQEARLSISHDGEYATAVCLGFHDSTDYEGKVKNKKD